MNGTCWVCDEDEVALTDDRICYKCKAQIERDNKFLKFILSQLERGKELSIPKGYASLLVNSLTGLCLSFQIKFIDSGILVKRLEK